MGASEQIAGELSCECGARYEERRYPSGEIRSRRMVFYANEGCKKSHDFVRALVKQWNRNNSVNLPSK